MQSHLCWVQSDLAETEPDILPIKSLCAQESPLLCEGDGAAHKAQMP